jgi:hypothetical protein
MAVVPGEENSLSQDADDQIFDDKVEVVEEESTAILGAQHVPVKVDRW